jgi:hypothetical protein
LSRLLPTVLLAAPDTLALEEWRRALSGLELNVVEMLLDRDLQSTQGQRIDIAVGRWNHASMDTIRGLHPAVRLVHCESGVPVTLVEAVGRGFALECACGPEDMREVILRMSRPRRVAERLAIEGLTVVVGDASGHHRLLDLSSAGLAFVLAEGTPVAGFLPGEPLAELSVWRQDELLLDGAEVQVTRLEPVGSTYRVGCVLRARAAAPPVVTRVIRDGATCAGMVQGAVRARQLLLRGLDDERAPLVCTRAILDLDAGELQLPGHDHDFELYDVVEGQFELGGAVHRFRTACSGVAPLSVRLPAAITVAQERATPRVHASTGCYVSMWSPFGGVPIERRVRDLGIAGVSFDIDAAADFLPVGTRISGMTLKSGKLSVRLDGQVRHLLHRPTRMRCGVEFEDLDPATHEQLVELIMHDRFPALDGSNGLDFDGLIGFMRKAHYLDEAREQALRPLFPEARHIHTKLRHEGRDLQLTLVVRDVGEVVGHVAGLHAYPRTWMLHHLAGLPGHQAAGLLSVASVERLLHEPSCEFFRMWFLSTARFPARVFGGFARKLLNGPLSDVRSYAHAMLSTDGRWASADASIEVGEAEPAERVLIEQQLVATMPPILVQAEDLTRGGLALDSIDQRYRRHGLHRHRRVLVARRAGALAGFALLEISSPGLNLADALSAFRVVVVPDGHAGRAQEVRRALLGAAGAVYAGTGRRLARCLIVPEEREDYRALGVTLDQDSSICWTCHRSQFQAFAEHMRAIFEEAGFRDRRAEPVAKVA